MVSIIVPCYNHELFLEDCMNSLVAQTYNEIELLINDDCSTDHSWEIICRLQPMLEKRFKRVYLHRNKRNIGITKSLNRLVSNAKGEYIKVLASDDMLAPDYLEKCVEFLNYNTEFSAVTTNLFVVPENTVYKEQMEEEKEAQEWPLYYINRPDFETKGLLTRIYQMDDIAAPATMVRKSVYDKIGLYDQKLCVEDWDFWLRMLEQGMRFGYLDETLCFYRKSSNSASSTEHNKGTEKRCFRILKSELRIVDKHKNFVSGDIYWARRNRSTMAYYYIAVNQQLKALEVYTRIQQIKNKVIHRRLK